jgi:hypothetical protein
VYDLNILLNYMGLLTNFTYNIILTSVHFHQIEVVLLIKTEGALTYDGKVVQESSVIYVPKPIQALVHFYTSFVIARKMHRRGNLLPLFWLREELRPNDWLCN